MVKDVARSPASILVGLCAVGLVGACSNTQSAEALDASGKGGTGGVSASGRTTSGGGTMAASSSTPSGGGTTGGTTPAGGTPVDSASTSDRGTTANGGSSAAGGVTSAGGFRVTGGATASGGNSAAGGSNGGVTATSGSEPAGGNTAAASDAGANDVRSSDAGGAERSITLPDAITTAVDTAAGKGDATATVSFKTQIQPLLKANCTSCHGATVQNMNVRVDTYANVKASLSDVTDLLVNGGMPPAGPLSDADIQLFQAWVDQGALNN